MNCIANGFGKCQHTIQSIRSDVRAQYSTFSLMCNNVSLLYCGNQTCFEVYIHFRSKDNLKRNSTNATALLSDAAVPNNDFLILYISFVQFSSNLIPFLWPPFSFFSNFRSNDSVNFNFFFHSFSMIFKTTVLHSNEEFIRLAMNLFGIYLKYGVIDFISCLELNCMKWNQLPNVSFHMNSFVLQKQILNFQLVFSSFFSPLFRYVLNFDISAFW